MPKLFSKRCVHQVGPRGNDMMEEPSINRNLVFSAYSNDLINCIGTVTFNFAWNNFLN